MDTGKTGVRAVQSRDFREWFRMRTSLWLKRSAKGLMYEMFAILHHGRVYDEQQRIVLVCEKEDGSLCGFIEATVRLRQWEGFTKPVGCIEGWHVDMDSRQMDLQGPARQLLEKVEDWVMSQGCREIISKADISNPASVMMHAASEYVLIATETTDMVFRKWLYRQYSLDETHPALHQPNTAA